MEGSLSEAGAQRRFRISSQRIISETMDDETIVIDLSNGSYFSLNATASALWSTLGAAPSAAELVDFTCERFAGDNARMAASVRAFLQQLVEAQLVVEDTSVAGAGAAPGGERPSGLLQRKRSFIEPALERFDDMQALLLADPVHDVGDAGWPRLQSDRP
jgi:hypothetical protein